jgi:uncharacterized OsmC-like protein
VTRFTAFAIAARLKVRGQRDAEPARQALEKAERNCLISRSLTAAIGLNASVEIGEAAELAVPGGSRKN